MRIIPLITTSVVAIGLWSSSADLMGADQKTVERESTKNQRVSRDAEATTVNQNASSSQASKNNATTDRSSQPPQTTRITGTIDAFRHVELRRRSGEPFLYSLVRLNLREGGKVVADLGPKRDLDRLNLQRGDQMELRGHHRSSDPDSLFMTDQLTVDGRSIVVRRGEGQAHVSSGNGQDQYRQNSGSRQMAGISAAGRSEGDTFQIKGRIQGFQLFTRGSGRDEQVLLTLNLLDGRTVVIDAGEQYQRGTLDLASLDLLDVVTVKGSRDSVNGREVLLASDISFEQPETSAQASSSADSSRRSARESLRQSEETDEEDRVQVRDRASDTDSKSRDK